MSRFEQAATCKVSFSDRPGHTMPKLVDVQVVDGWMWVWLGLRVWRGKVLWKNSTRRTITADKVIDTQVQLQEVVQ